jgi:hypothetical protein
MPVDTGRRSRLPDTPYYARTQSVGAECAADTRGVVIRPNGPLDNKLRKQCREGIVPTTVYFATNRVVTNASDPNGGYTSVMVPPLKPQEITYGTAQCRGRLCRSH